LLVLLGCPGFLGWLVLLGCPGFFGLLAFPEASRQFFEGFYFHFYSNNQHLSNVDWNVEFFSPSIFSFMFYFLLFFFFLFLPAFVSPGIACMQFVIFLLNAAKFY